MSLQGLIVGVCVLAALGYVLRPSLLRWRQQRREASGVAVQPPAPASGCSSCSGCSGCPSAH